MGEVIPFPVNTRPLQGLELFCTLPSEIKDIAASDDYIIAICEDGSYLIDESGEWEKIEF